MTPAPELPSPVPEPDPGVGAAADGVPGARLRTPVQGYWWCGLPARVDDGGGVEIVTGPGSTHLQVRFAAPWQQQHPAILDLDTAEVAWTAPGARARVRVVLGDVAHIEVVEHRDTGSALPPPVLVVDGEGTQPPAWLLGAGALGRAGIGVRGGVLHLRQQLGDCSPLHLLDGGNALALLTPESAAGTRRARWRCDLVDSWQQVGAQLPAWFPTSDTEDAGERLVVPLADAAVTSDAGECRVSDDATEVTVAEGVQHVTIAQASGAVRLRITGVPGVRDDLVRRAQRIVDAIDPRRATGAELWLVLHARAELDAEDFLLSGAEELAARLGRGPVPDPFAVAAVAGWAAPAGELDVARAAIDAAARWADMAEPPPGAWLATSWLQVAVQALDLPAPPALRPPPPGSLGRLEHSLVGMDRRGAQEELHTWASALGGGLPGVSVHPEVSTLVAAIARCVPPGWLRPTEAALLPVWERRLRASDDQVAAWLHW